MSHIEQEYIKNCKKQIEEQLHWLPSSEWKQRDFEFLLDLIEEKSKIRLSFSTIKRLWDPNFNSTPHISTLNALAGFLGYEDWSEYKIKNRVISNEANNIGIGIIGIFRSYKMITGGIVLILVLYFSLKISISPPKSNFSTNLADTVLWEVPQKLELQYAIKDTSAADYYILPEPETQLRLELNKKSNVFEFLYNVPGPYKIQIFENDLVIKEIVHYIYTSNWTAFCQYINRDRNSTIQIPGVKPENGLLQVPFDDLRGIGAEVNENQILTYYYINDFNELSADNFSFEIKLRAQSINEVKYPDIFICFVGTKCNNFISISTKGNEVANVIRFGNTKFYCSDPRFSNLICDTREWQEIKVVNRNSDLQIFLNGI